MDSWFLKCLKGQYFSGRTIASKENQGMDVRTHILDAGLGLLCQAQQFAFVSRLSWLYTSINLFSPQLRSELVSCSSSGRCSWRLLFSPIPTWRQWTRALSVMAPYYLVGLKGRVAIGARCLAPMKTDMVIQMPVVENKEWPSVFSVLPPVL